MVTGQIYLTSDHDKLRQRKVWVWTSSSVTRDLSVDPGLGLCQLGKHGFIWTRRKCMAGSLYGDLRVGLQHLVGGNSVGQPGHRSICCGKACNRTLTFAFWPWTKPGVTLENPWENWDTDMQNMQTQATRIFLLGEVGVLGKSWMENGSASWCCWVNSGRKMAAGSDIKSNGVHSFESVHIYFAHVWAYHSIQIFNNGVSVR